MAGIWRECGENGGKEKYNISDRTARRDLSELAEKENCLKMREKQIILNMFFS
jgi:hypothetical protein